MAYIGNSPANIGNYQVVDDISSSFNGTTTSFALASASQTITPVKSGQLLVSINGVLQEPDDTGTNGFKVSGSNIVFSAAPTSGSTFWGVYQGQNIDIGSPSDGAVTTAKLDSNSVTTAKLDSNSVTNAKVADNALSGDKIDGGTISNMGVTGDATFSAGNIIIGTSGKGIDFSAHGHAGGMTSELLDDYEEGTWTPTLTGSSGGVYTMGGINGGRYVKVGKIVHLNFQVEWTGRTTAYTGHLIINGIPFTAESGGLRVAGPISAKHSGIAVSNASYTSITLTLDPGYSGIWIIENQPGSGYGHSPTISTTGRIYSLQISYRT